MQEKNKKNWTIYILVGLLVIASFIIGNLWTRLNALEKGATLGAKQEAGQTGNQQIPNQTPEVKIEQIRDAFKNSLVKFGNADSKLIFIEVSDPSCPYCHIAGGLNSELNKQAGNRFKLVKDGGTYVAPVPEMRKLMESGKAAFAFIYSPGHGNGEMGTKAMYCAYEKGKFWQVHDKLMTSEGYSLLNDTVMNDRNKAKELADFLKSVFNPEEMRNCLESGRYDSQINKDTSLASSIGVQGTPGFFINTTKFAGAYSYKDMEETVNKALK